MLVASFHGGSTGFTEQGETTRSVILTTLKMSKGGILRCYLTKVNIGCLKIRDLNNPLKRTEDMQDFVISGPRDIVCNYISLGIGPSVGFEGLFLHQYKLPVIILLSTGGFF